MAGGVLALAFGGVLFAWSGLYSVAASRGHWIIMEKLLAFGMENSVETHAAGIEPPPDPDWAASAALGAVHFDLWCAPCHGGPGRPRARVADGMLPPPPDLARAAATWKPRELFWITKNGIKYTGMPAWPAQARDDEVWSLVAYMRAAPAAEGKARGVAQPSLFPDANTVVEMCDRCHGGAAQPPVSPLVPTLLGKPATYLRESLRRYAAGSRQSGFMQPIAAALDEADRARLASHYADQRPLPPRDPPIADDDARRLVEDGLASAAIPPCIDCHGASALDRYPRLAGQSAAYMVARLTAMRDASTPLDDLAAIMVPIARRLTDAQIRSAAAYFAGAAPGAGRAEARR